MTFTEEYVPDEDRDLEELGNYPTAFGVTFTPKVMGITVGVASLLGSLYLVFNWLMPAYTTLQQLKAEERGKQEQVDQQKNGGMKQEFDNLEAQLQQKEALKAQILALFANEKNLSTILLDISQIFRARNVSLIGFQPQGTAPTVISDGSLGNAVNNKLKRQTFNVQMKGQYANSQEVLRDLERLQPLILVKNLNSQTEEGGSVVQVISEGKNQARIVPKPDKEVTTTFLLDMIIPLNAEEIARLAPPPPPPAEGQPKQEGQQPPANTPPK